MLLLEKCRPQEHLFGLDELDYNSRNLLVEISDKKQLEITNLMKQVFELRKTVSLQEVQISESLERETKLKDDLSHLLDKVVEFEVFLIIFN